MPAAPTGKEVGCRVRTSGAVIWQAKLARASFSALSYLLRRKKACVSMSVARVGVADAAPDDVDDGVHHPRGPRTRRARTARVDAVGFDREDRGSGPVLGATRKTGSPDDNNTISRRIRTTHGYLVVIGSCVP